MLLTPLGHGGDAFPSRHSSHRNERDLLQSPVMPTIAFKSKIRTSSEDWTLTMIVQHLLVVGSPSETVHEMKSPLSKAVDVHLDSQLRITISGLLNRDKIVPAVVQDSCIAHHLVEYLRLNANELGITISDRKICGDTVICTSSRPFQAALDKNSCRTILVGLNITYLWQTTPGLADNHVRYPEIVASMNPFSRKQLSLPYLTAVNSIAQRFVTFQLVKRYPFIFGCWAQQQDIEAPSTASICKSLGHIISRSPHPKFQALCRRLSKLSVKRVTLESSAVSGILSDYLGIGEEDPHASASPENEEHDVSTVLMNFYRLGLRRPLFKGLSPSHITEDNEDVFDDSSEQIFTASFGVTSPEGNLENALDIEDSSGYNSGARSPSFECLPQYPVYPLSLPCDSNPEHDTTEPEDLSLITVNRFSDSEDEGHPIESRTPSSYHPRHKLSNAYPGWSPDIDSSQEKLDRSPVGMTIAHSLPGPYMAENLPVVLGLPSPQCRVEPWDKKLLEIFSDSDFEDRSGSEKEETFEFGTSTLQFDSDSGSGSTISDGHEIIAFECMGSQRAPLTPRSSISPDEYTAFGAETSSGEGGLTKASQENLDPSFLLLDFV